MFKSMSAEEYIQNRVHQFQGWYDKKGVIAKADYLRIRTTSVIVSLLVPISVTWFEPYRTLITTIFSLIVSGSVALEGIFHYGDQWKNYRSTEQFLSKEKALFQTGEGPYRDLEEREAFLLLVERCEAQISAENSATLNVIANAAQQPDAGAVNPA